MRVLVAFECSGVVREAFRALGHEAWSADLQPADDGSPFHIQCTHPGHILELLAGHAGRPWDLVIAHPPCTYLCNSGVHLLHRAVPRGAGLVGAARWAALRAGAALFRAVLAAPCPKLAVENPVMHKHAAALVGRRHDQTFQPYDFGDPESKRTCLWLRGLPPLAKTHLVATAAEPTLFPELATPKPERGYWANQTPSGCNRLGGGSAKERSRTYDGIARAMAAQWG